LIGDDLCSAERPPEGGLFCVIALRRCRDYLHPQKSV
jgi:hypothetical protein